MQKNKAHPYIPNMEENVKKEMLDFIGKKSAEDIFKEIPSHLRFRGRMNLPKPLTDEYSLRRHVEKILSKNQNCKRNISFLGGGTWQHYVPAVCDTIGSRDEFLTAYVGDAYSDHGKFQALFEFCSMIGDLVEMDAVNPPTYDWANAIGTACRMSSRINQKFEILVPASMSPGRLAVVQNYCLPDITITKVDYDIKTGLLDLADLKKKISKKTSAVYFEMPNYLGAIEIQAPEIVKIAHDSGAYAIAGVDPTSLGVLEAPSVYGADFAVGDVQPLGVHMQWGGGLGGFVATSDDKTFLGEYPSMLYGLTTTSQSGEYGFGQVLYERTSYAEREKGKDFIGTTSALHGIIAAVYLALMGPNGMKELGEGIMQRVAYAKEKLSPIKGVTVKFDSLSFKEFVLNFDSAGKTVRQINDGLKTLGIFGGHDLSCCFPELGQSALYAFTEVHTQEDIDELVCALSRLCK